MEITTAEFIMSLILAAIAGGCIKSICDAI